MVRELRRLLYVTGPKSAPHIDNIVAIGEFEIKASGPRNPTSSTSLRSEAGAGPSTKVGSLLSLPEGRWSAGGEHERDESAVRRASAPCRGKASGGEPNSKADSLPKARQKPRCRRALRLEIIQPLLFEDSDDARPHCPTLGQRRHRRTAGIPHSPARN